MRPIACEQLRCIVIIGALVGAIGCGGGKTGPSSQEVGPDIESTLLPAGLLDLDGDAFDLWKQEPARVTVVLFTRSDCPISNRYAPEIRRLHEKYHGREVDFYLVYVDPREQSETIRAHMQEYEYPCPGLRDPQHTLVELCQATTTPEAVVFDKDRTIVYLGRIDDLYADVGKASAAATTHDLADAIEATVEGRPVANPRTEAVGCPIADVRK